MPIHLFLSLLVVSTLTLNSCANMIASHAYAHDPDLIRSFLFYSPCTFPVAYSDNYVQNQEHYKVCSKKRYLQFVCDLHLQLEQQNVFAITKAFDRHRTVLEQDGQSRFEILIVKYLAAPVSTNFVNENSAEFGCLFRTPCLRITPETVDQFVHNSKTFTRVYTTALFERWFPSNSMCKNPRVLALVVLDGLLSDPRKLVSINLHTDDKRFTPFITNIQLESANALLQGMPLVDAIADLVNQVGFAYREFYATQGHVRRHIVPLWAWELAIVSVILVVIALGVEWYIVRRTLASKRSIPGLQTDAVRSKTHLIF